MSSAGHCDGWDKTVDSFELGRSSHQVAGEHCYELMENVVSRITGGVLRNS